MELNLDDLLGMELEIAKRLIKDYDTHKSIVIKELVSPKYRGDRKNDVCRIILAEINKEDIELTVSYF